MRFKSLLIFVLGCIAYAHVHAQSIKSDYSRLWLPVGGSSTARSKAPDVKLLPDRFAHFSLDESAIQRALVNAPRSAGISANSTSLVIPVPLPDGRLVDLYYEETLHMEPELASRFPSIKTFDVRGILMPMSGTADFTVQGFHAMLTTEQGTVFIDPRTDAAGVRTYISYYKKDYFPPDKDTRGMVRYPPISFNSGNVLKLGDTQVFANQFLARSGSQLTTYRLALAATGEYTAYHGGTVAGALSAMTTTLARVNFIYQRDLAIKMVLVANNASLIYTNAATDPYTNDNPSLLLTQNQSNIDAVIGSGNYDIGHVFSTGGGGLAGLGVVCDSYNKARGETGSSDPIGDPFDIDYVAHELGHQFHGNHTFNASTGACSGNRNTSTAFEPGSGTTVMAYAGICGAEDLQPHSDSLFHGGSINEIITFVTSGGGASCGARTAISNTAPVASAGATYTIPANTPFVLTGSATDANSSDVLTFAWDEMDLGTASSPADMGDQGSRPLFRSFEPSSSATRYFPKLSTLLANTSDIGERLPTTNRNLKFRLTVRDQKGGVHDSDVLLAVTTAAGPFRVTAPNGGQTLGASTTVTWNVANTQASPVNCANVNIGLSVDGGLTQLGSLLASSVPNTGSASVNFPVGSSSTARIRVQCANNIFFDVSDGNFSYSNTGTLPSAPTNAKAMPGNASALVTFTPGALGSGTFVSYYAACTDGTPSQLVGGPQTTLTVTGLLNGHAYTCSALTRSSAGDSAWSGASNVVTPGTATSPNNVTVAAVPLKALVSFTAPTSTGSSSVASYTATCSATGQTTQTATGNTSPITVKNLKPGVTYLCSVAANNGFGTGLVSTPVQIKARGVDLSAILSLLLDDDPPTVSAQPSAVSVVSGQNANFSVTVNGSGPFTYQWLKNGNAITGATASSYSAPVTMGDTGSQFSVVVTNSVGNVSSNAAALTVTASSLNDLVISEVSNCYYYLTDCWFEIYNPTASSINLSNYSLRTTSQNVISGVASSNSTFTLPSISIPSDGYVIISGNPSNLVQRGTQNIRLRSGDNVPYWYANGFFELLKAGATVDFIKFGTSTQNPTTSGKWSGNAIPAIFYSATDYGKSIVRPYPRTADTDTNTAADWISVDWVTPAGRNDVPAGAVDADGDGIPDSAEVLGGTFAGLDLYAMGVRADQKDILIEVDRMNSSDPGVIPRMEALQLVVNSFAAKSINVIFDTGTEFSPSFSKANFNFGQGDNVTPFEQCVTLDQTTCTSNTSSRRSIYDWKEEYMDLRRRSLFHYLLFGYSQSPNGAAGSSGYAEIFGNDFLISMGNWGLNTTAGTYLNKLINQQASTIMHELGHNLGLRHGGDENLNDKPNYWSVMNYTYQLYGLDPDPTSITAYERWRRAKGNGTPTTCNLAASPCGATSQFIMSYSNGTGATLNESALAESANVGRGAATGAYADWNLNGALTPATYSKDLNVDSALGVLRDYNDWANLKFPFSRSQYGNAKNIQNIELQTPLDPVSNDRQNAIQETTTAKDFLE